MVAAIGVALVAPLAGIEEQAGEGLFWLAVLLFLGALFGSMVPPAAVAGAARRPVAPAPRALQSPARARAAAAPRRGEPWRRREPWRRDAWSRPTPRTRDRSFGPRSRPGAGRARRASPRL